MKVDLGTMSVDLGNGHEMPLPEVLMDFTRWQIARWANHLMHGHYQTVTFSIVDDKHYSFKWACKTGRAALWVPPAGSMTEKVVSAILRVPGFVITDVVRALDDETSIIRTDAEKMSVQNDQFGHLEIA